VKITLNVDQMSEAIKLYSMLITGLDLRKAQVAYTDSYNGAVSPRQAVLTMVDIPKVPMPSKGKTEISQADIDKVYSSVVDRKLDVS
jgi:hypothetical protein